jgi:hypothetical protein
MQRYRKIISASLLLGAFGCRDSAGASGVRSGVDQTAGAAMVQSLLDRFHMKFHNQSKDFSVYALLIGADGTKLKDLNLPADEPHRPSCIDRPGVNMTRLGSFAMSDEDLHGMTSCGFLNNGRVSVAEMRNLDSLEFASLCAGLASVGLKLEPRKTPVPMLVINSILKSPTEN